MDTGTKRRRIPCEFVNSFAKNLFPRDLVIAEALQFETSNSDFYKLGIKGQRSFVTRFMDRSDLALRMVISHGGKSLKSLSKNERKIQS